MIRGGTTIGHVNKAWNADWWWVALTVLLTGLAITALVFHQQYRQAEDSASRQFEIVCREVELKVVDRLAAHEQILRSGAAFFAGTDDVSRKDWHEFAAQQKVNQTLPGIQGIGFAKLVPREELDLQTRKIRAEGFPDFRIWPEGKRDSYSSIVFLEPFSGRNLRAFGYDMLSEPVRRAAMEGARDSDSAVLSGKVVLVQEDEQDAQAGTLMYVPVFRRGAPHATAAERRSAIQGWVYSPYRMTDLMKGILGYRDLAGSSSRIRLEIFDGENPSPEFLLYDSQRGAAKRNSGASDLTRQIVIDAAGSKWLLSLSLFSTVDSSVAWLVLGGGTALSLLIAGLVYSTSRTSSQARKLAQQLTAQLSESETRWRIAVEGTGDGLFDWDVPSGTGFYSRQWKEMLGYSEADIGTSIEEWESRIHPEDKERIMASAHALLGGSIPLYSQEHRMRCKDGNWKWILSRGVVIRRDPEGKPLRVVGTHSDITEKRQTAEIKSRLISMASHEFRTPLATIRLAADLLSSRRDKMDEAGIQRALGTIMKTADDMTNIVADVLDLSAIERSSQSEAISEIALESFLRQLAAEFHTAMPDAQRPVFEWNGDTVSCKGIPTLLRRAVLNLLDNAVKYSPPGAPVVLRLLRDDRMAVIQVEDQGIGIPEGELSFLSDPFYRASNTAGIPGTGLGLAIVSEALQRMGGSVRCAKRDGGGSIFALRLPLATDSDRIGSS